MARYRDPNAPDHRVVFGGVEFIGGVTADIDPGPATLALFAAAGIVEEPDHAPAKGADLDEPVDEPAPPARRRK